MKIHPSPATALLAAVGLTLAGHALAQEQVVKIGHSGPLSGPNTFAGKDNENGVRLAIEELNAKKIVVGGKTLRFELQSEDDQCDPKTGVAVAQKFVDAGVRYVLGPYCSGVAIPTTRVYSEGNVLVSTVGTNPKVTESGYKNLFRIISGDTQIGAGMADFAAQSLKATKVGVIDDRTAFGQGLADEFVKRAKALNLNVVGREFTTDKAVDFMSILTSLKSKQVDAIFYGGYAPQAAPMARQLKQLGIKAKLLGGDTLCTPEMPKLGGDAINDAVYCAQAGSQLDKMTAGKAFKDRFKKRFGVDPDAYGASYYDQTMFIGGAMQKANSIDPNKVSEQIHKDTHQGVVGNYRYDAKGNLLDAPITISMFKNGQLTPLSGQ